MDFRRYRVNQYIRAREVRVVDENGHQIGIMSIQEALKKAKEKGLDLVEIAPDTNPPVCKIMDFSKFKYQQEKKEKELRKAKRHTEMKEIYIKPTIADHDLQVKLNHIKEFLQKQHPTKILITYFGRAAQYMDQTSEQLLEKIKNELQDYGNFLNIKKDENRILIIVEPKKK
jgi:translation initiation factor IF-3